MRKRDAQSRFARLFAPLLMLLFAGAPAAQADSASAVAFVQATCLAHIDDLVKLAALANEAGWQQTTNSGGPQLDSITYRATAGGETYSIVIAEGAQGRACGVAFEAPFDVKRDEFFGAISGGMRLTLVTGLSSVRDGVHVEAYEIGSEGPKKKLLQLSWAESGNVLLGVTVFAGR